MTEGAAACKPLVIGAVCSFLHDAEEAKFRLEANSGVREWINGSPSPDATKTHSESRSMSAMEKQSGLAG
ncbi:hypothetical protein MOX02_45100 [Methylobacterium oxalidis]|uniref:Uncharacterized protein n=1 Tax=Methylobacterium oxalidis TaxID=944322 RepID=A0A512J948_9HYPH|nr:hypothetical protein MOX02_45100 [Methylobacterium oxalidis]GLS65512.1 hypothetical protein GCM10007888_38940 [Methylobacterium oxalidis]